MKSDRWRRIDDLFDAALKVHPGERDAWLRSSCGNDEGLLSEVVFLLGQDARAERNDFLPPPETANVHLDKTASWLPTKSSPGDAPEPVEPARANSGGQDGWFAPKAAISAGARSHLSVEARSLAKQRLRELTILYFLIVGLMLFWKFAVVQDPDLRQAIPYVFVLAALGGAVFVLSRPRPLSPAPLKFLELAMIGTVAAVFALAQYQAMLDFSQRNDPVRASSS